jgi:GT2 family glycosyltransferase
VVLKLVFWGAVAELGWVYAGYPLVAAVAAHRNGETLVGTTDVPSITVAVAVHQGAGQIEERIRDVLAQESSGAHLHEVLVGSDGSTDGTDAIVARLARDEPRLRVLPLPRGGQTPTQEALFAAATGDIVVLTDAETRFAPGCLAALASAFTDPRIGCATGKLVWFSGDGTAASTGEGLYWRYELFVRELESRAGWLTTVTGAIVAIRRSAFKPVPAHSSLDELLPVYVREQGGMVVYVPDAVAMDRPISSASEQFRTRARISTRGIAGTISVLRHSPIRSQRGPVLAMVSHKLMRWATPWAVLAAALAGLGLARKGPVYAAAPTGLVAMAVLGATAEVAIRRGRRVPRPVAFARSFGVVNLAFALGWINVLRGHRYETWVPSGNEAAEASGVRSGAALARVVPARQTPAPGSDRPSGPSA